MLAIPFFIANSNFLYVLVLNTVTACNETGLYPYLINCYKFIDASSIKALLTDTGPIGDGTSITYTAIFNSRTTIRLGMFILSISSSSLANYQLQLFKDDSNSK